MRCIKCQRIFPTTDFYDHIIVKQECVIDEGSPSRPQYPYFMQDEQFNAEEGADAVFMECSIPPEGDYSGLQEIDNTANMSSSNFMNKGDPYFNHERIQNNTQINQ